MLHTTFKLLRQHHACKDGYREFRKYKSPWGDNQPISLQEILEVRGLRDALWALRAVIEPAEREVWLLACDYAAHAGIPLPRNVEIVTARVAFWATAGTAARVASIDAAWAAGEEARASAWAAARAATWNAERDWQKEKLLEILSKFPLTPGKEKI